MESLICTPAAAENVNENLDEDLCKLKLIEF